MEGMRPTLAGLLIGAVLSLSGAAASAETSSSLLSKNEVPVAAPQPKAPPPSCETVVRIHQATLARSALLDAATVRHEFPELAPNASTLKTDECKRAAAELLRDLALRAHHEAQGKGTIATYGLALDLYRAALRHAQGSYNPRLRFGIAEVLFQLGELGARASYCEAAPLYSETLDGGTIRREDAALAVVVAWDRCLGGETYLLMNEGTGRHYEPDHSPRPFRPLVQSLLTAMTVYLQSIAGLPPTPTAVLIKYRRARILYEHNRITEALPLFREITEKHPGSTLGIFAANLQLDCLAILLSHQESPPENREARLEEISLTVERMLNEPLLTRDREFVETLHKIQLNIGRKRVEQIEKAGLWSQAGDGYVALATRFPQDPRVPELLYNAAVCFERCHRLQEAITAREQLVKQHPGDRLAKKSLFRLAQSYAALTDYERAAELYEAFAQRFPGELAKEPTDPSEIDAMRGLALAIHYRARLGQRERAFAGVEQLIKTYGVRTSLRQRVGDLFFALSWIYDEADPIKQKEHLLSYRKLFGSPARIDLHIITAARLGEIVFRAACPVATTQGLCLADPLGTRRPAPMLARKPALLSEAGTYFSQALQAYGSATAMAAVRDDPDGTGEARIAMIERAVARVRLLKADQLHEELRVAKSAKEREGKQREALALYQLVLGMPAADGNTAVTAAARVAQLHLAVAQASCPLAQGSPCGKVPGVAPTTGVWAQAEQALLRCVEVAAERTAPEWAGLCAAELYLLRPKKHRLDTEVQLVPDHPSPLIDRAPVLGVND